MNEIDFCQALITMRQTTWQIVLRFGLVAFAVSSLGQTVQSKLPTDPGMYVESAGSLAKIIGQIAEFKRSGSILASTVTAGIKSQKANIQLLGAHAQTVVPHQPVFYFIPPKQEADAGVNAGDLILIRLEEKSHRRQFEVSAVGLWRASAGISLTHQIQVLRSEVKPGVYTITPAGEMSKGEYALYLSRGEGMAPYVYDFSVQDTSTIAMKAAPIVPRPVVAEITPPAVVSVSTKPLDPAVPPRSTPGSIGAFSDGNPDARHDGVTLASVTPGGPADEAGIKAGDVILAVNDHYLFTVTELRDEIALLQPGTKAVIRYRRYSMIYEIPVVVGVGQ